MLLSEASYLESDYGTLQAENTNKMGVKGPDPVDGERVPPGQIGGSREQSRV